MKILIDARLYGSENTGNGRYTQNLIENLAKLDPNNEYIILLRKNKFNLESFPKNFRKVEADFGHYSFAEQIKLPFIIARFHPDLVHFPHFNVPVLYFGKYIVTIHDLIMHKFKGGEATTRPNLFYKIWRMGYFIAFAKAIHGSCKIIVPSNAVKSEILDNYRVSEDKICVTYE